MTPEPESPRARPRLHGVYETALYAADVDTTAAFYERRLGMRPIEGLGETGAAFRLADGGMLLIFDPENASVSGRSIPEHGARGPGHVAFSVPAGELDAFERHLRAAGVEIERDVAWPAGGRSLYLRDPAGNSVELIEGEAWP